MQTDVLAALHSPYYSVFEKIALLADKASVDCYLVGGFVRDLFIGRQSKDIDILVVGNGIEFAKMVSHEFVNTNYTFFKNFGTANVKLNDFEGLEIEFVGARKESYRSESRNPTVEEGSLHDDISRRDFTINTLAISLKGETFGLVTDLYNGITDLENRLIKTPLSPDITYSDDPLRMMRAIRFASQLHFEIETESLSAIKRNAHRIGIISQERITEELNKIILSPKPSIGFNYLFDTGLLKIIFPEMVKLYGVETINGVSHKDNFYHTLKVLDNLSKTTDNLWLRWSAILHDIGKPASKRYYPDQGWTFHGHEVIGARMTISIFKKLKLPQNEKMRYVEKLVHLHLRPIALTQEVSDSAIRRLIVDAGDDIEDLFLLCKADITSKNPGKVKRVIQGFEAVEQKVRDVEERDELRNWKPPVTGEDIMHYFNVNPSRQVGVLKDRIAEAILSGAIPNQREKALELMKELGVEMGLELNHNNND